MLNEIKPVTMDIAGEAPMSTLERRYITQYLLDKGYTIAEWKRLPTKQAHELMCEACRYAALKLAEVESRAKFRHTIQHQEH